MANYDFALLLASLVAWGIYPWTSPFLGLAILNPWLVPPLELMKTLGHLYHPIFQDILSKFSGPELVLGEKLTQVLALLTMAYVTIDPVFMILTFGGFLEVFKVENAARKRSKRKSANSETAPRMNWKEDSFMEAINAIIPILWERYHSNVDLAIQELTQPVLRKLKRQVHKKLTEVPNSEKLFENLSIEVEVGERSPKIESITTTPGPKGSLLVDIKCSFKSSCQVFVMGSETPPFIVKNLQMSNVILRIYFNVNYTNPNLDADVKLGLLDPIKADWDLTASGLVKEVYELAQYLVKLSVYEILHKKLVLPPILAAARGKMSWRDSSPSFSVDQNVLSLYLLEPTSVLKFTVVRGEGFIPPASDLRGGIGTNFCNITPKISYPECKVTLTLGGRTLVSDDSKGPNPEWNFSGEFPIEPLSGQNLHIEVVDKNLNSVLGKTWHPVENFLLDKFNSLWMNVAQRAKILIETTVIPLSLSHPNREQAVNGVVCVVLGTVDAPKELLLRCRAQFWEGNDPKLIGILKPKKVKDIEGHPDRSLRTFNASHAVRVTNLRTFEARLTIDFFNRKEQWICGLTVSVGELLNTSGPKVKDIGLDDTPFIIHYQTALYTDEPSDDQE